MVSVAIRQLNKGGKQELELCKSIINIIQTWTPEPATQTYFQAPNTQKHEAVAPQLSQTPPPLLSGARLSFPGVSLPVGLPYPHGLVSAARNELRLRGVEIGRVDPVPMPSKRLHLVTLLEKTPGTKRERFEATDPSIVASLAGSGGDREGGRWCARRPSRGVALREAAARRRKAGLLG